MFNPIAIRTAKTLWSFDHSECNRVKRQNTKISKIAVDTIEIICVDADKSQQTQLKIQVL